MNNTPQLKAEQLMSVYGDFESAINFAGQMASKCYKGSKNMGVFWYNVRSILELKNKKLWT